MICNCSLAFLENSIYAFKYRLSVQVRGAWHILPDLHLPFMRRFDKDLWLFAAGWWGWHVAWLLDDLRLEDTSGGLWSTTQPRQGQLQAIVASSGSCSAIYRKLINIIEGGRRGKPFFPSLLSCMLYEWNLAVVWGCISSLTFRDKCFFQSRLWHLLNIPMEHLIKVLLVSII